MSTIIIPICEAEWNLKHREIQWCGQVCEAAEDQ